MRREQAILIASAALAAHITAGLIGLQLPNGVDVEADKLKDVYLVAIGLALLSSGFLLVLNRPWTSVLQIIATATAIIAPTT